MKLLGEKEEKYTDKEKLRRCYLSWSLEHGNGLELSLGITVAEEYLH